MYNSKTTNAKVSDFSSSSFYVSDIIINFALAPQSYYRKGGLL